MTRTVRGVLEAPDLVRLDEPVDLPAQAPVEVTIHDAAEGQAPAPSTLLALMGELRIDGPADFSERWEEYLAEDERERSR